MSQALHTTARNARRWREGNQRDVQLGNSDAYERPNTTQRRQGERAEADQLRSEEFKQIRGATETIVPTLQVVADHALALKEASLRKAAISLESRLSKDKVQNMFEKTPCR